MNWKPLIPFGALLISISAFARPEYAAKTKLNCAECHIMPHGGGPRTLTGKSYGSHSYAPAKTSSTDVYAADFRTQYYLPTERAREQSNGLFLMTLIPSVHPTLHSDFSGLLSVDFSTLSHTVREAVLIWKIPGDLPWVPKHALFGRFWAPFGLLTDEHRTYTRMLIPSSLRDFEMGGELSWNFTSELQFDLALTNGFQTGGNFTQNDLTFAITGNARWNPPNLPFFVGASSNYHYTDTKKPSPFGISGYAALTVEKIITIPLTLLAEWERAHGWSDPAKNPGVAFFSPGTATAGVKEASSIGIYTEAIYSFSEPFALTYKYDHADLDLDTPRGSFHRHGMGARWHVASNLTLTARLELVPNSGVSLNKAAQNAIFAMLRFWI